VLRRLHGLFECQAVMEGELGKQYWMVGHRAEAGGGKERERQLRGAVPYRQFGYCLVPTASSSIKLVVMTRSRSRGSNHRLLRHVI
jgi:hypothetical protein